MKSTQALREPPQPRLLSDSETAANHDTRLLLPALTVFVLTYALLAGCYTLRNFDLGWQLAAGRYIAQTGAIPRQDVFSYTAGGKEWIYPAGGQLLLYGVFRVGGYPALTLAGMLVCLLTVALVLVANYRGRNVLPGLGALWLAVLAIPPIAARSSARADMFTTLLFAAVLAILWRARRGLSSELYLLPFLSLVWGNLHQSFIFGLALFPAFLVAPAASSLIPGARHSESRTAADATLRESVRAGRLALIGAASAAAVLLNPWGWRLYASLWRVRQDMAFQRGLIGEASPVPLGWWRLRELLRFTDADSGFWLLAALALAGLAIAVARRQLTAALILAGTLYLGLRYARAQALLAIAAVVVLPEVFAGLTRSWPPLRAWPRSRAWRVALGVAGALLVGVIGLRASDLVTSRYYVRRGDIANFGFGLSWWFPERAFDFIARERLPGRLYHDYNLGGCAMWRLWPQYQVMIDGRAAPFMPGVFLEQQSLAGLSPDSPEWQSFLDRWGINTLVVSLARYGGYRVAPGGLCESPRFRLVYLDEVSGVWLRVRPENEPWLKRLGRPCGGEPLPGRGGSRVDRYNFLANAGQLYYALGNDEEALRAYSEAEKLFTGDANLRLAIAQVWQARGRPDLARLEYQNTIALGDSGPAWHSLGALDFGQGRYREAAGAFARAAARQVLPHESYRMLGESYLALKEPAPALEAFDRARQTSRYGAAGGEAGRRFLEAVEKGRERALRMLAGRKGETAR